MLPPCVCVSLPLQSSVRTSPQKIMRPFGGVRLYFFKRCCVDVIADKTDKRLTRLLIQDAVPYSSVSILLVKLMSCFALRIKVMAEVPFPRAASNILTKRFTFHCSICLSSSVAMMRRPAYAECTLRFYAFRLSLWEGSEISSETSLKAKSTCWKDWCNRLPTFTNTDFQQASCTSAVLHPPAPPNHHKEGNQFEYIILHSSSSLRKKERGTQTTGFRNKQEVVKVSCFNFCSESTEEITFTNTEGPLN